MTTLEVFLEKNEPTGRVFRAQAGGREAVGPTVGQAIDGLSVDFAEPDGPLVVIVQSFKPDRFFTAAQQRRLSELMDRWRAARDSGSALPPAEQAELDALIQAELRGATERSAELLRQVSP